MNSKHEDAKAQRFTKEDEGMVPLLAAGRVTWSPGHRVTWSRFIVTALVLLAALFVPRVAAGIDQAKPGEGAMDPHAGLEGMAGGATGGTEGITTEQALAAEYAKQDRTGFERDIQLDAFRRLAVMHLDQVKIIDSWARQNLYQIRHRQAIDGKNAVLVALDMAFRPQAWLKKNIVYVEAVPIREELGVLAGDATEARRIREEALVSPAFLFSKPVLQRLEELSRDSRQVRAVNQVMGALEAFADMRQSLALVPPTADRRDRPWVFPMDIFAADAKKAPGQAARAAGGAAGGAGDAEADLAPYTSEQKLHITRGFHNLEMGWQSNDVKTANEGLAELAAIAPAIDPGGYPSATRRAVELWYNRAYSGTLVAFVYFTAMVLFFLVAVGVVEKTSRVRTTALGIYGLALACHITAMGVRWWISGRIPIQNQFESVMGSACTGCLLGFLLETRWLGKVVAYFALPAAIAGIWYYYLSGVHVMLGGVGGGALFIGGLWLDHRAGVARAIESALAKFGSGIFGTAFGFVGFLATTVLMAAPYVFGMDLGAAPGKVAGILSTGWLYIHVNIVIASYALIIASAVVALVYLGTRLVHWINPIEPGFEREAHDRGPNTPGGGRAGSPGVSVAAVSMSAAALEARRKSYLETLDQANMVVLQMAFWMLGVGVLCGAVWADQSWGRPWGWDPKETFALVTWMVYLVIVHVRLVIKFKSDATAVLSLVGCGVMLFNWIGVNYFLKGLHSYA